MLILIVEDEPLTALMADTTLAAQGHEVLGPVSSVQAALAAAAKRRPDLVLTDINLLDDTCGTDLAREMDGRWGIPVLFISAAAQAARNARDVALGILHKPYTAQGLTRSVAVVERLMKGDRGASVPVGLELFA